MWISIRAAVRKIDYSNGKIRRFVRCHICIRHSAVVWNDTFCARSRHWSFVSYQWQFFPSRKSVQVKLETKIVYDPIYCVPFQSFVTRLKSDTLSTYHSLCCLMGTVAVQHRQPNIQTPNNEHVFDTKDEMEIYTLFELISISNGWEYVSCTEILKGIPRDICAWMANKWKKREKKNGK